MFGWFNWAASLASLRNIFTKLACFDRCGRIRLITIVFSKPSRPAWRARKISAMPPTAIRSMRVYLPKRVAPALALDGSVIRARTLFHLTDYCPLEEVTFWLRTRRPESHRALKV